MPGSIETAIQWLESRRLQVDAIVTKLEQQVKALVRGSVQQWGFVAGSGGTEPQVCPADPCGLSLPDKLTATVTWGLTREFSATVTLNFSNCAWTGTALLDWPGMLFGPPSYGPSLGPAFYDNSVAATTPVTLTFGPDGTRTDYTLLVGLLTGTIAYDTAPLLVPTSGTLTSAPNFFPPVDPMSGQCSPWSWEAALQITNGTYAEIGNTGPIAADGKSYGSFWNLRITVTSPN